MGPIRSIAELPFRERALLDLLNLQRHRVEPDPDFTGFGYARAPELWLEPAAGEAQKLTDVLVLALHCSESPEAMAHDLELEFCIDEVEKGYSVTLLLSDFLRHWLPRVRGDARTIVLALCNRTNAALRFPDEVAGASLWYAFGDVESWRDHKTAQVILSAAEWHLTT